MHFRGSSNRIKDGGVGRKLAGASCPVVVHRMGACDWGDFVVLSAGPNGEFDRYFASRTRVLRIQHE